MKTISVKQPWASLIVYGIKDIENRTWKCPEKYVGQRVLIHASAKKESIVTVLNRAQKEKVRCVWRLWEKCVFPDLGAIIGSVEIVGCVVNHPSIWAEKRMTEPQKKDFEWNVIGEGVTSFNGDAYDMAMNEFNKSKPIYNWVLANPIVFEKPIPCKGRLGFFEVEI